MRHRKLLSLAVVTIFAGAVLLSACSEAPGQSETPPVAESPQSSMKESDPPADISNFTSRTKQTSDYFDTITVLCLYDDFTRPDSGERLDSVWASLKAILKEVDDSISVSIPTSDIARFNDLSYGESISVTADTAHVIEYSKEMFEVTDGRFDPTVYPLVDLWGFTPRFTSDDYEPTMPYDRPRGETGFDLPDQKYIDAFLQLLDFDGIVLTGDDENGYTLTKMVPPVTVDGITYQAKLDLGGIGKGYIADLVRKLLVENGYEFGYFSCGGSSMTILKGMSSKSAAGTNLFELDIHKPRPGENDTSSYGTLMTSETALSTSGDYDHAYKLGDTIYCHIIDTKTGYPINMPVNGLQKGIATATIIGGDAVYDEGISTALCTMPLDEAINFINSELRDEEVALVVYCGGQSKYEVVTNMPSDVLTITDPAYVLASRVDSDGRIQYTGSLLP